MHISEGVLSAPVLIGGAALALGGVAVGLKSIKEDDIPKAAILAAVFFVASLIHFNVGPAALHLVLSGLIGLFMGWAAFPVILAGLLLQGVLFQFGGLTVLGLNTFNMALPAVVLSHVFKKGISSPNKATMMASAFACGGGSILVSAFLVALSLYLTGSDYQFVALQVLVANLPGVIIEGVITALVVGFLAKVRPALLQRGADLNGAVKRP